MRYYRLLDDMHIPGRWHLGEMTDSSGDVVNLDDGVKLFHDVVHCAVSHRGTPLDFTLTSFNSPVVREPLARRIDEVASEKSIQFVDLIIPGYDGFEGLNVLSVLDCLDESRSEYIKWTEKDHRADLVGRYRSVTHLSVDRNRIPEDAHIFRIERWRICLVVSEVMKEAMEAGGCLGAKFLEVT